MSSRPDSDMIGLDEARDLVIALDSGIGEMGTMERLARSLVKALTERDRLQRACDEGLPREVIRCPACGKRHVDGASGIEFATRPHHTHMCEHCGNVWDNKQWSFGAEVPPRTVHEPCGGDEITGCICGMTPIVDATGKAVSVPVEAPARHMGREIIALRDRGVCITPEQLDTIIAERAENGDDDAF